MHIHVNIYTNMRMCIYKYICINTYRWGQCVNRFWGILNVYTCVCVCVCVYIHTYTCVYYANMHTYIYTYICMCTLTYTHTYLRHKFAYAYIFTLLSNSEPLTSQTCQTYGDECWALCHIRAAEALLAIGEADNVAVARPVMQHISCALHHFSAAAVASHSQKNGEPEKEAGAEAGCGARQRACEMFPRGWSDAHRVLGLALLHQVCPDFALFVAALPRVACVLRTPCWPGPQANRWQSWMHSSIFGARVCIFLN